MKKNNSRNKFIREHETYCRAAKFVNDDRGKPLSKEFLRRPFGLKVKAE